MKLYYITTRMVALEEKQDGYIYTSETTEERITSLKRTVLNVPELAIYIYLDVWKRITSL